MNKVGGAIMVGMTLVSIPLMDRAGRRTLHLWGLGGMFIFSIFITISLLVMVRNCILNTITITFSTTFHHTIVLHTNNNNQKYTQALIEWVRYVAVVATLAFVLFFAVGPGSIPWMITAELFSQGPRPAAMSVAVLVNWLANFFVGLTFLPLQVRNDGQYLLQNYR